MLADIQKVQGGYLARFERRLKHPVEEVWAWLTENDKLAKWFSELRVEDLRTGGVIKFDMQDGTFEAFRILEFKPYSVLEYTWGEDVVRFELSPEPGGCLLIFSEKINRLTEHTPKDLAGWHVCLEVIQVLLERSTLESRHDVWKIWHEKYKERIRSLSET